MTANNVHLTELILPLNKHTPTVPPVMKCVVEMGTPNSDTTITVNVAPCVGVDVCVSEIMSLWISWRNDPAIGCYWYYQEKDERRKQVVTYWESK